MDSSKFGKSLPFTFAALSDIDVFITDNKLAQKDLDHIQKSGVEAVWQ